MPTKLQEYLFDLNGYLHLKNAIDRTHINQLNTLLDTYLDLEPGAWRDWVHRHPGRGETRHLHNLFEIGEPFEQSLPVGFAIPASTLLQTMNEWRDRHGGIS